MASHVVSQPHSKTNPTGKHRVVVFKEWHRAMYGDGTPVVPVSEHDSFDDAMKACTRLNSRERSE